MIEKASLFDRSTILETTVSGFKYKGTGFIAITRGAIFVVLEKRTGARAYVIREQLTKALFMVFALSTSMNYTSRCLTVAEFWRWPIDESKSFADNADHIAIAVAALWGEINNIKKSGPPSRLEERSV
jgi:hypothetical protein